MLQPNRYSILFRPAVLHHIGEGGDLRCGRCRAGYVFCPREESALGNRVRSRCSLRLVMYACNLGPRPLQALLGAALGISGLVAQQVEHPSAAAQVIRYPLSVREELTTDLNVGPYQLPARCDADGSLYLRQVVSATGLLDPVVKIGTDGKRKGSFAFGDLGAVHPSVVLDFSISSRGDLYALATTKDDNYLAKFRPDTTLDSVTKIPSESGFRLSRFAIFSTGQILMTGVDQKTSQPETVVLDRVEDISRQIDTKEKFELDSSGHVSRENFTSAMLSSMVSGDDGNVYVMRPSNARP